MLPKPETLTVRLHPTTQRDIWERLFWVQPQERFLLMGAATGGRHTVVGASTIPTLRRTVALTGAMVIILMRRLTMITIRELMAGKRVRMAPMARRQQELLTILIPGLTPEALQSRLLMAPGVRRRPTTRTPGPMPKPGKARVRTLSGAARMFPEETRALPWDIIRLLMEP